MSFKSVVFLAAGALALAGCTTSQVLTVQQPGDRAMSCSELQREFSEIERVMDDAQGDRGVNTANVTAVLLFWPAAVGNYLSADQALEAAQDRQTWLYELYEEKSCDS
ncbi:hypothetical protein [Maricaulis sp.]|uniref:hypothetical protein n=1 Tax=Maricaulis sp. TaxID=1486257 RepID=UPI0025BBC3FF|nr:hypothetical protein [Maricaulis sp.]